MLRVGLTGGIASGKSTVAAIFARLGAHVASSDEMGRQLMQPGEAAFQQIVDRFGPSVLTPENTLDRAALSRIAFAEGRVDDLNAIVHPAVIAAQDRWMQQIAASEPHAVCMVESALIFETKFADPKQRFDRIILVMAPEDIRIQRFLARLPGATAEEARLRIASQLSDFEKLQRSHYLIRNEGSLDDLERQVSQVWRELQQAANAPS